MIEEEDILETNYLRMESYKALNRELTLKNQELRQYGAALREELCDVRRRLMEERTSQATLKKAVISVITESFNRILCLLYDNDADKQLLGNDFASGDATRKERSEYTKNNRRSSHLIQTNRGHTSSPPRKSFVHSNINIRSPLVEVQKNNVTVRNRRAKQPEDNVKELIEDSEDSEEDVDILDRAEHQLEVNKSPGAQDDNSISHAMPLPLPVVIEETSSKMDMSSIMNHRGFRVFQLKLSNSAETTGNTLIPDLSENSEKLSQSRVLRSPLVERGNSRSEVQQSLSSLTVPDIPFNESSFNNSSMLKAPSSTPYKKEKNNKSEESQRSLRVLIPRLKQSSLSHYGITQSAKKDNHSQKNGISSPKPSTSKARKRNCVKNIPPQIESKSSPRLRPKRKAAEVAKSNLVEPTLTVKMRRQT